MTFVTPQANAAAKPTPTSSDTPNQPKTTANAVPVLTLLMQVMPIAASTRAQMVKMSSLVSRLYSTGEAAGSMKYPGLVATGFWNVNALLLTPTKSDRIASSGLSNSGKLA